MSFPSVLSPWYVVQRLVRDPNPMEDTILGVEYFTNQDDGTTMFQPDKARAAIFATVQSASRVADVEEAEVRTLYSKDHAKEFKRD